MIVESRDEDISIEDPLKSLMINISDSSYICSIYNKIDRVALYNGNMLLELFYVENDWFINIAIDKIVLQNAKCKHINIINTDKKYEIRMNNCSINLLTCNEESIMHKIILDHTMILEVTPSFSYLKNINSSVSTKADTLDTNIIDNNISCANKLIYNGFIDNSFRKYIRKNTTIKELKISGKLNNSILNLPDLHRKYFIKCQHDSCEICNKLDDRIIFNVDGNDDVILRSNSMNNCIHAKYNNIFTNQSGIDDELRNIIQYKTYIPHMIAIISSIIAIIESIFLSNN